MVNILLNRVVLEFVDWCLEVAQRRRRSGSRSSAINSASPMWPQTGRRTSTPTLEGSTQCVRRRSLQIETTPIIDMLYVRALGVVELAGDCHEEANAHLAKAIALTEQVGFPRAVDLAHRRRRNRGCRCRR